MYGGVHINFVDFRGQLERMAFLLLTSTFWDETKAISLGKMSFFPTEPYGCPKYLFVWKYMS